MRSLPLEAGGAEERVLHGYASHGASSGEPVSRVTVYPRFPDPVSVRLDGLPLH